MSIFDLFKKIEKKEDTLPISHLIVGLGNPEAKYNRTRHNAGFAAIDFLCDERGFRCDRLKHKALVGEGKVGGRRVLLMKPQTYMNFSGEAVIDAATFYKIPAENIIIISDDISLDVGRLRIRKGGSAGGHKGLKSINQHLGTESYPRIKLGVGQKPKEYDQGDWVLGKMAEDDEKRFMEIIKLVPGALDKMVAGDIEGAMCDFNGVIK